MESNTHSDTHTYTMITRQQQVACVALLLVVFAATRPQHAHAHGLGCEGYQLSLQQDMGFIFGMHTLTRKCSCEGCAFVGRFLRLLQAAP